MPNPAVVMANHVAPASQRLVVDGYVSTVQPAPTTFAAPLYVIVPEMSTEVPLGPCDWGALHGLSLPAQGAKVVVVFDEREVPVVVWWEGEQSPAPAAVPALVSALPSEPADGQEVYFQNTAMAEAGVVWHLRYRAASGSTHKWELVGGSDIAVVQGESKKTSGAGSSYEAINVASAITFPIVGDYDFWLNGTFLVTSATATNTYTGLGPAAEPKVVVVGSNQIWTSAGSGAAYANISAQTRFKGASAIAYTPGLLFTAATVVYTVTQMEMRVRPVRVG